MKQLISFSVYNRWGKQVFTTQKLSEGWDGTVKGTPADNGTYIYQITGEKDNGNPVTLTGTVVLLRQFTLQ